MRRFYPLFVLVVLVLLAVSCREKRTESQILHEKVQNTAKLYLQDLPVDSITIQHMDTLTELGYAKIMLEMLENMKEEYNILYKQAVANQDERTMNEIEHFQEEIRNEIEFFFVKMNSEDIDDRQLILYMVSAAYFENGNSTPFLFFTSPEGNLHELDPFDDNLLK